MRKSVRRNCLQLQSENDGNLTKSSPNSISTSTLPAATTTTSSSSSSTMVLNASTPSSPPITRSKRNRLNIGTNEKLSDSSISSSNSLYSGSSINLGAKNQSTSTSGTAAVAAAAAATSSAASSAASSTLTTTSPSKKDIINTLTPTATTRSTKSTAATSSFSSTNTAQSSVTSSSSPSPPITVKVSPFSQSEAVAVAAAASSSSLSTSSSKKVESLDSEINLNSEVSTNLDIDSIKEIFASVDSEKGQKDLNIITDNIAINPIIHNEPATASNTEISTCSGTTQPPTTAAPSLFAEVEKTIDSRKVEPIKINLNRDIVTRKVTYKQISKSSPEIVDEKKKSHKLSSSPSSSSSSSSLSSNTAADLYNSNDNDNTNGNVAARSATNAVSGPPIFSEAHILPKLTIRGNCDIKHSVVPRLTIKMDSSNSPINSVFKETAVEICGNHDQTDRISLSSSPSPSPPPPPLPKLTIKTSGDIIESKITPAKHSPSASSSSCYVADSTHSPSSSCLSPIPKLTIKTVPKLSASPVTSASYLSTSSTVEGDVNTPGIPKLTIKTISTTVCSSSPSSSSSSVGDRASEDQNMIATSTNSEPCIVPKLTIRTEPSEPNSNQVVPKLTIRTTKDSSPSAVNAGSGQTIPKFTIKTVQDSKVQPIPKLTISFNDYYCGNVVPSSQSTDTCVIRRTPKTIDNSNSNSNSSSSTTMSSNEVEKIPKLTIRRRSTTDDDDNNSDCSPQKKIVIVQESEIANKVPKLTIKQVPAAQQNDEGGGEEERVPKITIKPLSSDDASDLKIPKITIKSIPPSDGDEERIHRRLLIKPVQDDVTNVVNTINKVPKLTIRSVQNTDNSKSEFVPINIEEEPPSEIVESSFEESDQHEQDHELMEEIKEAEKEVEKRILEHVEDQSEQQSQEEPESDVILTSCPMDIDDTCLGGTISNNQLDCAEGSSSEEVPSKEIASQDDIVDSEQVKLSVLSEVEEDTTICLTAPVAMQNESESSAREECVDQTSILQRVLESSCEDQLETVQPTVVVAESLSSSSLSSLSQQPTDEYNSSIKNPPLDTNNMTCNIINLYNENSLSDSNNKNNINSDVISSKSSSSDGNPETTSHSDSANRGGHSVQEGGLIDCNEVIEIDDDDYEDVENGTKEHTNINMNVLESQNQQQLPLQTSDANPKIGAQSEYLNAFRKRIIEAALTRQLSAAKQQQHQQQNLLELTTKNESASTLNNRVVYHNQMSPLSTISDKSLKRISTIDSNGIFDEPPSKKLCPPLIDLTQSSNVMQINSNEDSNPQTVELLELSTVDSNTSTLDGHHQISTLSGGRCFPTTNEKLQNHFTDNSTSNIDMENNMNVDFRNMITCFKAQNVMMDNLQNNNKYIDGIEVKNLVPDSDSNTLIYIQEESNSDCIILNNYSSDSMMKVDNSEDNSFLQFQGSSNKRMNGNEHSLSMSHSAPIKRPRGRPRKDGKPAGSVKKESSRKYQNTINNSAETPMYSPPSFTAIGQTPSTTAEISPNNSSYATPRKYVRRGGTRGGIRGSGGSIKKRGGVIRNRPRCIGGLLHTPDKSKDSPLFSPDRRKSIKLENKKSSPWEVFEEDTRMSADSVNNRPKPCEYLNNDDTQSSVLSSVSNTAEGNASQVKKRAKMEVTAPEGKTDYTVDMIAEYDWPPPKGCCPARNRDTFMIQEQIAQYLGIKSFKRKYPDLPRRQIDMEERNWLQEKGLVTEKMCDLGITAVWASDVLDIMCIDFYEKYEEYKNFLRQKQLRDSEAKQKAMAAEAVDKTLQARERALQSAAKWNSHFNKERKEDRRQCLDLQSLVINVPTTKNNTTEQTGVSENFTPSSYPIALVPGQFAEHYTVYTPEELRCYPINTVLGNPDNIRQTFSSVPEYADADSDSKTCWSDNDSSSSDWSSSSGSDSDTSSSSDDEDEKSDSELKCNVCLQNQNKNTLGYPEVFVRCYVCRKKTHPSCIEMPARMAARVRNYNWQCADCKYCSKCKLKRDETKMLFCEQCDRGYHIYCIKIKNIPEGRWHCEHCAICVRCGTNKPEGNVPTPPLPLNQKPSRWKKPKWIHEYRLDHITKLREHCSTLCIPCARQKNKGCR